MLLNIMLIKFKCNLIVYDIAQILYHWFVKLILKLFA